MNLTSPVSIRRNLTGSGMNHHRWPVCGQNDVNPKKGKGLGYQEKGFKLAGKATSTLPFAG